MKGKNLMLDGFHRLRETAAGFFMLRIVLKLPGGSMGWQAVENLQEQGYITRPFIFCHKPYHTAAPRPLFPDKGLACPEKWSTLAWQ